MKKPLKAYFQEWSLQEWFLWWDYICYGQFGESKPVKELKKEEKKQ